VLAGSTQALLLSLPPAVTPAYHHSQPLLMLFVLLVQCALLQKLPAGSMKVDEVGRSSQHTASIRLKHTFCAVICTIAAANLLRVCTTQHCEKLI
jgi:hypothetical protein